MPYTRIQEQLTTLMTDYDLSPATSGVEGLLIQLIGTATDEKEAQRYLNGLQSHLRGELSVSVCAGDVLFRAPYSG